MDKVTLFSRNSHIVCVGKFNPAIITPDWLADKQLITSDDLNVCRDTLQASGKAGVMVFESSWFRLQALAEQLSISSIDGATPRIADLASGLLALLPETPISAFGLNFDAIFKVTSYADYHKFGDTLIPKHSFIKALPTIGGAPSVPGLLHLAIAIDNAPRVSESGNSVPRSQKRITIEPSNLVTPGLFFLYNDHILTKEIKRLDHTSDAVAASDFIRNHWQESFEDSKSVFDSLISSNME